MIRKEISDFQVALVRALNFISLGRLYKASWGAEFSWEEADRILQQVEKYSLEIDIKSLNKEELEALGFPRFDKNQYCIPSYMYKAALAQGIMSENDDTDTRFGGMWAFVSPKDEVNNVRN